MELTTEEKQAILNQRLKQFAVEKYGHEINKELLVKRKADSNKEAEIEIDVEIAKVEAIMTEIEKVIEDTKSIVAGLPVEAKEAGVVEAVK
jgi:hypothetical protein